MYSAQVQMELSKVTCKSVNDCEGQEAFVVAEQSNMHCKLSPTAPFQKRQKGNKYFRNYKMKAPTMKVYQSQNKSLLPA